MKFCYFYNFHGISLLDLFRNLACINGFITMLITGTSVKRKIESLWNKNSTPQYLRTPLHNFWLWEKYLLKRSPLHNFWWWEKYLSKCSPLKHTCSWCDKLIALYWTDRGKKFSALQVYWGILQYFSYFLLQSFEQLFSRARPSVCCQWLVDSYQNKKYLECNTELFSCSDLSLIIPKSNCFLLAWCHLCCIWESIYLMHVIVFNHQEITLNESRKLLSNYFVKQLWMNLNEILCHAIFS